MRGTGSAGDNTMDTNPHTPAFYSKYTLHQLPLLVLLNYWANAAALLLLEIKYF